MTVADLEPYGMERMDDDAIRAFLDSQSVGVLGLPTDGTPYLLPLSYALGEDGDRLYFTYVLGSSSRKASLSERATRARFLVYEVETLFRWESVLLAGSLSAVPEEEWEDLRSVLATAWRPSVLQSAATGGEVAVYEFAIEERTGIRQTGLAPGFRENIEP
jgi:nitroimidazol reductase NimA-like FMN-containing flavoprotein (pyridoxamine 5'-phosphate oxidase superfamily)